MYYKHYFLCAACRKHVTYITAESLPVQPGVTHGDALENGGMPSVSGDKAADSMNCFGRLAYCSGYDVKHNKSCVPAHRGSEYFASAPPPPPPHPDWTHFAGLVDAGWLAFVASGYSAALRGINNNRQYRPTGPVNERLRNAGGVVAINGGVYTVSESRTAGVSLHRTIPQAHQQGAMKSFIFHL